MREDGFKVGKSFFFCGNPESSRSENNKLQESAVMAISFACSRS
jgi:hypothetical protein